MRLLTWVCLAFGVMLAATALIPTDTLAAWFAHPARGDALNAGGEAPLGWWQGQSIWQTGALLLRLLAPPAGIALAALALWKPAPCPSAGPAPDSARLSPVTRVDVMLLALAMLLALLVRLPLLAESLWYDEIAAYMGYGLHGPGVAIGNYYTQANHMLQSVLTAFSAQILGPSELSLRLPALLAGVLCVPSTWWLGREAGDRVIAHGSALAMALMPLAVLESTEARGYAFMMLLATTATAALLWARRARAGGAWSVYALACALGVWSHLVTACVPIFHAGWSLFRGARSGKGSPERRRAIATLTALAVAALLTLALYAPAIPDMLRIRREFAAEDGNEPTLLGPQGVMMMQMLGGAWNWWGTALALPLVAAGLVRARQRPQLALGLILCVGGSMVALVAPLLGSWLYARFLVFLASGVALAAGAGGAALIQRTPWTGGALTLAAAVAWVVSVQQLPARQPLREAVAYIDAHRQPQDRVLAIGLPDDVQQWYALAQDMSIPGTGPYGRDFARLNQPPARWVLMLYPRAMGEQWFEELTARGYQPVLELPGWIDQGDGRVVVWRRPP